MVHTNITLAKNSTINHTIGLYISNKFCETFVQKSCVHLGS